MAIALEEEKKIASPSRTYETVVVLNASLANEDVEKAIDKIKAMIDRNGGEVLFVENMGRRKLAYEVTKEKRGIYILVQFKGVSATVSGTQRAFKLDPAIIRFMTVKIMAKAVRTAEQTVASSQDIPSSAVDSGKEPENG